MAKKPYTRVHVHYRLEKTKFRIYTGSYRPSQNGRIFEEVGRGHLPKASILEGFEGLERLVEIFRTSVASSASA